MAKTRLGDVAFEVTERAGDSDHSLPVFGVDRSKGLTTEPRYQAKSLSKYKRLSTGMFAYNPMRLNIGSIGYCNGSLKEGLVSPDYVVFKCREEQLRPLFFWYHTRTSGWSSWTSSAGEGSVRERIYFRKLSSYSFYLPNLEQQDAALAILTALDDKIELNRQMNETLEAMAQAIFGDWFVDFGPTRRKLEGVIDPVEIMGGLVTDAERAQQLADLFPSSFGDDGLPAGWRDGQLSELVEIQSGKRPPTKVISRDAKHPYPVWGGNGVGWYSDSYLFEKPFIITGRVGTLGTVYRVNGRVWASDNALCVFPKTAEVFHFVYYAMSTFDYQGLNSGSTQPLITQSVLKKQSVLIASGGVYEAFSSIVEKLMSLHTHNCQNSDTLAATRDFLLPKLMSGEIELRDVEDQLEVAQ